MTDEMKKAVEENVLAGRDTTFDNIEPKSIWLSYDNQIHGENRFALELQINGIKKKILDFYIPGLAQDEGHQCGSVNLSWIVTKCLEFLVPKIELIEKENQALRERIKELESQIQSYIEDEAGEDI